MSTVATTEQTFEPDVLQSDIPVLVDFWATWCAPCKAIAPVLEDLANEFDGKVKIAKVDVTENPALASRYNIRNIPALVMFKNGEVVAQQVGAGTRSQLAEFMTKNS